MTAGTPPGAADGGRRLPRFPTTRYQGSKRRVLGALREVLSALPFGTALDLYSGTGTVSLLLRWLGKQVTANDYLQFNAVTARLLLTASTPALRAAGTGDTLLALLNDRSAAHRSLVGDHYAGVFFTDAENAQIDTFAQNVVALPEPGRSLFIHAVGQALMKKRPYNLFHRANLRMRLREVRRGFGNATTWEGSIAAHAAQAVGELLAFPFEGLPEGRALHRDAAVLDDLPGQPELVYLDPPYLNARSVPTDYGDLYGFLDGLCCYELFARGDRRYAHRPLHAGTAGWQTRQSALEDLRRIAARWPGAWIVLSYRNDGQPGPAELTEALATGGREVETRCGGEFTYALSRAGASRELFLVAAPLAHRDPADGLNRN